MKNQKNTWENMVFDLKTCEKILGAMILFDEKTTRSMSFFDFQTKKQTPSQGNQKNKETAVKQKKLFYPKPSFLFQTMFFLVFGSATVIDLLS